MVLENGRAAAAEDFGRMDKDNRRAPYALHGARNLSKVSGKNVSSILYLQISDENFFTLSHLHVVCRRHRLCSSIECNTPTVRFLTSTMIISVGMYAFVQLYISRL